MTRVMLLQVCSVVLLAVVSPCSAASTIDVPGDYGTIQAAINAASTGAVIVVAAGTYYENLNFKGKAITVRGYHTLAGARAPVASRIDGQALGPCVTFGTGEGAGARLEHMWLRNGRAANGGGIACSASASPTISHCTINANTATGTGGGVYVGSGCSPTLSYCSIYSNTAAGDGGGIYHSGANLTVSNCTVSSNTCQTDGAGGGLMLHGAFTISDTTISSNSSRWGAGLYLWNETGTLQHCTVSGNTATQDGGGVYFNGFDGTLHGSSLTGNEAVSGGGLFSTNPSTAAVDGNTFADNTATTGAGLFVLGSSATVSGNLLRGNQASGMGGGLYAVASALAIVSNTFAGNAAGQGAGLYAATTAPTINNCIVAGSTAGTGVQANGCTPTVTYCCVFGNAGGNYGGLTDPTGTNGNLSVDPRFVDAAGGNYRLRSCNGHSPTALSVLWPAAAWPEDNVTSPCLDAGDPGLDYSDEPAPNGGRINMGADGNTAGASLSSQLASRGPADGATLVPRHKPVVVVFKWPVYQGSAESHFSLTPAGGSAVAGTCEWVVPCVKMLFHPTAPLAANTSHTVALASGIRRKDDTVINWAEGFAFTTTSGPAVVAASPQGPDQPRGRLIKVTFDQAMQRPSVENNLSIVPAAAGTFSWSGRQVTFDPTALLAGGTTYRVTIGKKSRNSAGVMLGLPYSFTFTTVAATAPALLLSASAVPAGPGAQVTLRLSAPAEVSAAVLNVAGREVAALQPRSLPAGVASLAWNGRSVSGTPVPAGSYLVRVTAHTTDGASTSCLTPLVR